MQKTNKKDVQYLNQFQKDYKDVLELFQKLKCNLNYQKKFGDILSELIQEKVNISKELSEYFRYIKYRTDGMGESEKYKMYYLFGMILFCSRYVDSYGNFDIDDTYRVMCNSWKIMFKMYIFLLQSLLVKSNSDFAWRTAHLYQVRE